MYINVPFVTIEPKDIPDDVLKRIPEHIARQYNVVLFAADDNGVLSLAMEDPDDVQALNFIQKEIGYNIKVFLATKNNILDCLENYRGNITDELDEVVLIQSGAESDSQNVSEEEISENSPIAQTVNLLLEYAIKSGASDIHIEPREERKGIGFMKAYLILEDGTVYQGKKIGSHKEVISEIVFNTSMSGYLPSIRPDPEVLRITGQG